MTARTSALRWKHYGSVSLVAAGLISGGVLLSAPAASATESATSVSPSASNSTTQTAPTTGTAHKSHLRHSKTTPLTGAVAAKVKAVALAKYPGATVRRVDTDSHGTYEAHLVTTAGVRVTVKVGKDFTVTNVHTGTHTSRHEDGHTKPAAAGATRPDFDS